MIYGQWRRTSLILVQDILVYLDTGSKDIDSGLPGTGRLLEYRMPPSMSEGF